MGKLPDGYVDLTEGMILCELCSKHYHPADFVKHSSEHTREEVLILKKLAEKTAYMSKEEYENWFTHLEIETYRRAILNKN